MIDCRSPGAGSLIAGGLTGSLVQKTVWIRVLWVSAVLDMKNEMMNEDILIKAYYLIIMSSVRLQFSPKSW